MSSGRFLLLVDDSSDDVELTLTALEDIRFETEVVVRRDGQEALDFLLPARGAAAHPCLIVLDLKMPRLGGLEVLRRLRESASHRAQPVMILTSSDELRDKSEAQRLGADFYVQKPINFDGFLDLANSIAAASRRPS